MICFGKKIQHFNIDLKGSLLMPETIFSHTLTLWCYLLYHPNNLAHVLCKPNDRRFYYLHSKSSTIFMYSLWKCNYESFKICQCWKISAFASFGYLGKLITNCEYEKYKRKPQNSPLYVNTQHSSSFFFF